MYNLLFFRKVDAGGQVNYCNINIINNFNLYAYIIDFFVF